MVEVTHSRKEKLLPMLAKAGRLSLPRTHRQAHRHGIHAGGRISDDLGQALDRLLPFSPAHF